MRLGRDRERERISRSFTYAKNRGLLAYTSAMFWGPLALNLANYDKLIDHRWPIKHRYALQATLFKTPFLEFFRSWSRGEKLTGGFLTMNKRRLPTRSSYVLGYFGGAACSLGSFIPDTS